MRTIFLIMIGISMLNADLTKSGDIVTDSISGLQWQDDKAGAVVEEWQGAIDRCESLVLAGNSDWRVPNINELKSIIDKSKRNLVPDAFEYVSPSPSNYLSSTTVADRTDYIWFVRFEDSEGSDITYTSKGSEGYVRCVRSGY